MTAEVKRLLLAVVVLMGAVSSAQVMAEQSTGSGGVEVMRAFADAEVKKSEARAIDDRTKRIVMFVMGVPLLLLLIATAALGVAMGIYGKPVFVAHMVCAGLSLTLAAAHAVVGLVWFYPF